MEVRQVGQGFFGNLLEDFSQNDESHVGIHRRSSGFIGDGPRVDGGKDAAFGCAWLQISRPGWEAGIVGEEVDYSDRHFAVGSEVAIYIRDRGLDVEPPFLDQPHGDRRCRHDFGETREIPQGVGVDGGRLRVVGLPAGYSSLGGFLPDNADRPCGAGKDALLDGLVEQIADELLLFSYHLYLARTLIA
jgi:hypothetical protein